MKKVIETRGGERGELGKGMYYCVSCLFYVPVLFSDVIYALSAIICVSSIILTGFDNDCDDSPSRWVPAGVATH